MGQEHGANVDLESYWLLLCQHISAVVNQQQISHGVKLAMDSQLIKFHDEVVLKYHLYNGLFLALPFGDTEETGALLSAFTKYCHLEIAQKKSPKKIIHNFFKDQARSKNKQFIQNVAIYRTANCVI